MPKAVSRGQQCGNPGKRVLCWTSEVGEKPGQVHKHILDTQSAEQRSSDQKRLGDSDISSLFPSSY